MSHREAARVFGVERAVVSKWMRRWRDGGWEGLQERRRGRRQGEQAALEPWQQGVIVTLVKERNPDQLKLPGFQRFADTCPSSSVPFPHCRCPPKK